MTDYPRPSFTADAIVLSGEASQMKLLVIKRKNNPYKDSLAFPGGFLDPYELPRKAVIRELQEETELLLDPTQAIPLQVRAKKGRDPRGWTITQPYLFWLPDTPEVNGQDDASMAFWIELENLESLAFDHGAVLCEALSLFWHRVLPGLASPLGALLPPKVVGYGCPSGEMKNPLFFGGTFNPWHEGHLACVKAAPQELPLVILPDKNPFKESEDAETECSWFRYQQLRKNLEGSSCCVYPGFGGSEESNPTYSWVQRLGFPFSFLMGEDSFVGLKNWLRPEIILQKLSTLYVVPRLGKAQERENALKWVKFQNPLLEVKFLDPHPYEHLSSTSLRKKNSNPS